MKAAPVLPKPGDLVAGKYRIEKVVGEGGMGVVYAAHHLVLEQRVALKVLLVGATRADDVIERFVREAQAAARLQSEHVVRVMDAGALENELPFFVMEHLEGRDLADMLKTDGPFGVEVLADYALQVLAALAQAHAAGIIHRDIKPANFFLAAVEHDRKIIKILDFGISKQESDRAQWKELTGQSILGTPAYMSPEQLRCSKNVDAGADIWSLGVALYELATGVRPFDGDAPGEIFAAILEKTPAPVRSHRPELPEAFEEVLRRCLQRDRALRFGNVLAMAEAIAPLGSGKWSHLLQGIERALASSKRFTVSNEALVNAAVRIARSTRPPPPLGSDVSVSIMSIDIPFTHTDLGPISDHVPVSSPLEPASAGPPRSRRWLVALAFVLPLAVLTPWAASRLRPAARRRAAPPVAEVDPAVASAVPGSDAASPAGTDEPPSPSADEASASPPPTAAASATPRPSATPKGGKGSAPKKDKPRPSFLKTRE
jgi:serine/threonine-protein kinase